MLPTNYHSHSKPGSALRAPPSSQGTAQSKLELFSCCRSWSHFDFPPGIQRDSYFVVAPTCNNPASAFQVSFFKSTNGGFFNSTTVSAFRLQPETRREIFTSPSVKYRSPSPFRPMKVGPTPDTSYTASTTLAFLRSLVSPSRSASISGAM